MADENSEEPLHREMRRPGGPSEVILNALESQKILPSEVTAEAAVSGVMCVLLQQLSGGEALGLTTDLPQALQEMLVPCAINHEQPELFSREEFLVRVSEHLKVDAETAERIAQGVFAAVKAQLAPEENEKVDRKLPPDMSDLWNTPPSRKPRPEDIILGPPDAPSADVLQDLADQGKLPPGVEPEEATAAVMCVLSQRLSAGEAGGLVENLPPPLQPMVRPCELHFDSLDVFDREEFINRVGVHLDVDPEVAERIVYSVFGAVKKLLPAQEIQELGNRIPGELAELWADAAPGGA